LFGYDEVVDTVQWGLAQLGNDVSVSRNEFRAGRTNIVFGAQMLAEGVLSQLPVDTIIYNFEQIGGVPLDNLKPNIRVVAKRFRIWDYSASNVTTWRALAAPRVVNVPVGWAPILARIPRADHQDIDVLIYGSPSPPRLSVFADLSQRGMRCVFVCGLYGPSRDSLIARSKIVLNINKHQANIFEIVRVSYLLANAKAVVADRNDDTFVEPDVESAVAFCARERIVSECERLLDDEGGRRELEARGRSVIEQRIITKYIAAALADDAMLSAG
jgi:hypothetical protein